MDETHTETRELAGRHAEGRCRATSGDHRALAGARAWEQLATAFASDGQHDAAVTAARRGIEELGDSYFSEVVIDDTDLKLFAADERLEAGALADGAEGLRRVLSSRLEQYVAAHEEDGVA